jgi:hypothetical protein
MRPDIGESGLNLGDAVSCVRRFCLRKQRRALSIGAEHEIEQGFAAFRCLLNEATHARACGNYDFAALGRNIARDRAELSGLPDAVSPDETDPGSRGNPSGSTFEQWSPGDVQRNVVNHKHAGFWPTAVNEATCKRPPCRSSVRPL